MYWGAIAHLWGRHWKAVHKVVLPRRMLAAWFVVLLREQVGATFMS